MHATCQCGALRASLPGPTEQTVACHCHACQRRGGSPFGLVAYYAASDVVLTGAPASFTRRGDSGGDFTNFFCPTCGTTLWISVGIKPGVIGIPVGTIDAAEAFPPARSVWEQSMHPWVAMPADIPHFTKGRSS